MSIRRGGVFGCYKNGSDVTLHHEWQLSLRQRRVDSSCVSRFPKEPINEVKVGHGEV